MAIYRRFRVQQKYVNGQPTEEYRLGFEIDSTDYNSLEECNRGSDCTQLEYRWVDMESADDYICDGTNKYKKQRKQQKCVTEEDTWTNVYPYEYQKGDLIEHDSVDCGYSPTGEFHIYGTTDGHGSINISPSKEYYSSTDVVTITALPSTDYSFNRYNYGRNLNYGSVTYNSVLSLTMSHNWYVSAEYIDITPYYKIYPSTDGYGTLTFNPSQSSYRKGTEVTIIDTPSVNYVFSWFNYGSTIAYGTTAVKSSLKLNMTNDWYVSAVHSYVKPECEGYLICGFKDGTSKSYYWNKSTLSNSDFATILALDGEATWAMNLDGCIKKIYLHGLNLSWISLNGLEFCGYENFYNCTSLQDIYLYGSKIVDFKSAKFYKDTEIGPFFLYSAPASLTIHVDCNNYGEYERLYSLVSKPRLILFNDTNTYVYPFFIDHITCESVQPIISYTINISEVEGGKTIVVPSKEYYRQYDEVSIYALNSYNYSFKQLNYGENSEYSLSTSSSIINLFITQDWYIKPEFSTSYGENANGLLYYNYRHNSERLIPWSLPYLTSENTHFDILSCIDYGQTIMKISNMALNSIQYGSEYIGGYISLPVCREIGSDGINIVGLTSIDAKQVEVIQDKGLAQCEYLSGLDFPNLVAASYNAFFDTDRITFVNMPKLKYCPGFFIGDTNYSATLESMTLDNVLYFSGGFYRRTNLATFNAPNCKVFNGNIDTFIFTSIKSLNLPNCCLFSFRYNSQPYEQLTSLVLSDKFFMYSYTIGDYSPLLNISEANIGKFPKGWNNTQLTNNNCNVYGISSSSFATSDVIRSLEYINLDNCFYIGSKIFTNAHYISEIILKDCQIVSDQAFGRGYSLTKVDLRNAYHIGSSAFCNNPKLSDVNVESVMILGQDAFKNCGMSVLSLPNAVWINNGITECKNLRDIYLNSSIKTIFSSDCFNGCNSNLLIHVPSSQYSRYCIEDGYNYISLYDENILAYSFVLLRNLLTSSTNLPELDKVMYYSYVDNTKSFIKPSISILDSNMYNGQSAYIIDDYYGFITSLSYSAFASHKNLAYINLPSCNSIPESAFYRNKVLKYINVKNAEFIGSSAFANCGKLSNTIILNKCSYIGNNAFYNCSYLTSVYLMSESIVNFDPSTTFAYCNYTLKIYVPNTLLFYYFSRYGSMSVSLDGGTLYYNRILTTF